MYFTETPSLREIEKANIIGEYVNITSAEDADIDEDQGMVM